MERSRAHLVEPDARLRVEVDPELVHEARRRRPRGMATGAGRGTPRLTAHATWAMSATTSALEVVPFGVVDGGSSPATLGHAVRHPLLEERLAGGAVGKALGAWPDDPSPCSARASATSRSHDELDFGGTRVRESRSCPGSRSSLPGPRSPPGAPIHPTPGAKPTGAGGRKRGGAIGSGPRYRPNLPRSAWPSGDECNQQPAVLGQAGVDVGQGDGQRPRPGWSPIVRNCPVRREGSSSRERSPRCRANR